MLFAIGVSMICMAGLRRLPMAALVAVGLGWFAFGELLTGWLWTPPGSASPLAAVLMANYASDTLLIKYPVLPWLAMMVLGWAMGRHASNYQSGKTRVSAQTVLWVAGVAALVVFVVVRGGQGYGDMFLHRSDGSWQQWLHVSKYPPSLSYAALELGLMSLCLAFLARIEPLIGVRNNGVFLVFGQTAMFFYLVHRLVFEIPATYFGLRGVGRPDHYVSRRGGDARGALPRVSLVSDGEGCAPDLVPEVHLICASGLSRERNGHITSVGVVGGNTPGSGRCHRGRLPARVRRSRAKGG